MHTENKSPIRIIRLDEVITVVNFSKSSIYDLMNKGLFPSSFKIGGRAVAWLESDIMKFINALAQERSQDEIKELVEYIKKQRLGGES
jgi:prophage regulatory protein